MPEMTAGTAIQTEQGVYHIPRPLTPLEKQRQAELHEMMREAEEKGWHPATLVNLLPLELNPPSVKLQGLKIRGVPLTEELWATSRKLKLQSGLEIPYVTHVILDPAFDVCEAVAGTDKESFTGSVKQKTWWPIQLAQDIVMCANTGETKGGVFCYRGAHIPLANPDTLEAERKQLEDAYVKMISHLTAYFDFAEEAFAGGNDRLIKSIRPYHKWCTRYLLRVGVLKEEPKWLTRTLKANSQAPVVCPQCGKRQTNEGGAKCDGANCGFFLDPFRAFKDGMFDLETPGATTMLRRCSKQQLQELGLYPEIRPLKEHLEELKKGSKKKAE